MTYFDKVTIQPTSITLLVRPAGISNYSINQTNCWPGLKLSKIAHGVKSQIVLLLNAEHRWKTKYDVQRDESVNTNNGPFYTVFSRGSNSRNICSKPQYDSGTLCKCNKIQISLKIPAIRNYRSVWCCCVYHPLLVTEYLIGVDTGIVDQVIARQGVGLCWNVLTED